MATISPAINPPITTAIDWTTPASVTTTGGVLPERPVYNLANAYYHSYPWLYAATDAALAPGNRYAKLDAGTDSLARWLGFRWVFDRYMDGVNWLYERNPRLADFAHRHPILSSIPVMGVGMVVASWGGAKAEQLLRYGKDELADSGKARKVMTTALENPIVDRLALWGSKLGRAAGPFRPLITGAAAVASLGFLGWLAFRAITDAVSFSRRYKTLGNELNELNRHMPKEARMTLSPYELKAYTALQRDYPEVRLSPTPVEREIMQIPRSWAAYQPGLQIQA